MLGYDGAIIPNHKNAAVEAFTPYNKSTGYGGGSVALGVDPVDPEEGVCGNGTNQKNCSAERVTWLPF